MQTRLAGRLILDRADVVSKHSILYAGEKFRIDAMAEAVTV